MSIAQWNIFKESFIAETKEEQQRILLECIEKNESAYIQVMACDALSKIYIAEENFLSALAVQQKGLTLITEDISQGLFLQFILNHGRTYFLLTDFTNALEVFAQAEEIQETEQFLSLVIVDLYLNISSCYYATEEYLKAKEYLQRCIQHLEDLGAEDHIKVADVFNNLGRIAEKEEEYNKAAHYHLSAVKLRKKHFGEHAETAFSLVNAGVSFLEAGQGKRALEFLEEAQAMYSYIGMAESVEYDALKQNIVLCKDQINKERN